MNGEKILDISLGAIFRFALLFLIFYTLFSIKSILILIIFALIISILFNPAIDFLIKRRFPRIAAAILIYFIIFGVIGGFMYSIASALKDEIVQFIQFFPQYYDRVSPLLKWVGLDIPENFVGFIEFIQNWLGKSSKGILSALSAIFGGIFSTITIFSIALFLSLEEKGIEKMIFLLFPKRYEAQALNIWERVNRKVAGWFGARIIASFLVALGTFIACKILAVKYAISLGLLAGITNIVPIVGPIIAGAIIALFAFLDSWTKSLFILIIFILIQQVEGNIISPILTRKFIGIPPVLVLIALLVGGKLWGVLGAILAIPLAGVIFEFLNDFLKKRKEEKPAVL